MENTKDQYIGAEIHSARSVNPDGETVTLDGDTVVWTGGGRCPDTGGTGRVSSRCNQTDGRKRTAERGCHSGIRVLLYIQKEQPPHKVG